MDSLTIDHDRIGQLVTAGPVEVYDFSFFGDPVVLPGETLTMSIELFNSGTSGIVPGISIELSDHDTSCLGSVSNNSLFYGNIEPQEILEQEAGFFMLSVDDDCEMGHEPYIGLNIMVMSDICWTDTISFVVGEQLNVNKKSIPEQFSLKNPYPNPFNPVTTLSYELPEDAKVNITINISGIQRVFKGTCNRITGNSLNQVRIVTVMVKTCQIEQNLESFGSHLLHRIELIKDIFHR